MVLYDSLIERQTSLVIGLDSQVQHIPSAVSDAASDPCLGRAAAKQGREQP
jgi:hypothetical protein